MALEILSAGPAAPTDRPALLFVHGMWHGAWCWEQDQRIGAKALQRTATRYGAAFEVVPDVAHDVMLDPNWTSVAEPLHRWLSSHWP